MLKIVVVLAIAFAIVSGERVRYDNYHVFNVKASSQEALELLQKYQGINKNFRFLSGVHSEGQEAFVLVAPGSVSEFIGKLESSKVEFTLVETNAQKEIEDEEKDLLTPKSGGYDWSDYHDLEETYSWMESLAEKYPNLIETIVGGKTYEDRQILGVKLSYKKGNKGIFLEGGMHSREWIGPAAVSYFLNEFLTSTDPAIRDLAENYDWYIFPHANPDGYAYTRAPDGDRLWRMTRSKQNNGCYGVDPNRNWDFHWREVGISEVPCDETFAGESAFSEIETKSLSEYIKSLKGKIELYISFHSFSQYVLYPYGHTKRLPDNFKDYQQIYNASVEAVGKRYGTKYTGGNIHDAIYAASGGSIDWVFGHGITKLAFAYELRPSSLKVWVGFKLPKEQIIPTSEETLDSLIAMVNEAKKLNYFD
ncbi:hypothetical protein ACFFRR_008745 [Megaselia abdita]